MHCPRVELLCTGGGGRARARSYRTLPHELCSTRSILVASRQSWCSQTTQESSINGINTTTGQSLGHSSVVDTRTAWLARCQEQGYGNLSRVQASGNSSQMLACTLLGSGPGSYVAQQCTQGYTGTLCAACEPGFTGSLDFDCRQCPSLARTIGLGLLGFAGTCTLVLYTTYSNVGSNLDSDEADHSIQLPEVLKVGDDDIWVAACETGQAPAHAQLFRHATCTCKPQQLEASAWSDLFFLKLQVAIVHIQ
jgi:hypothetical protein